MKYINIMNSEGGINISLFYFLINDELFPKHSVYSHMCFICILI